MSLEADRRYMSLIYQILQSGQEVTTRNSKCLRLHTIPVTFNSTPLISLRRTAWKLALREWEWFMSGSSYIEDLHPSVRPWWEPWVNSEGSVVNNYSSQFRNFYGHECQVDSIQYMLDALKDHPYSRRNCITTWNTAEMANPKTPITNCHSSFIQWFVNPDNTADMTMYQRSADVICGLPHNWIQSWAFMLWACKRSGRKPGVFNWIGGDVHIYEQHLDLARRIVSATPQEERIELVYTPTSEEFLADDFSLSGEYKPVITEKAEMVV